MLCFVEGFICFFQRAFVTISIGIAIFENEDAEGALEKADKALYEAKHLGRNNILLSEELQAG